MTFTNIKIRWAKKLLRAKYFVVLTDKESVIAMDGADPGAFSDIMALSAQTAEVNDFYEKLGALVKEHEVAVHKLTGGTSEITTNTKKPSASKSKKVTKIKVKQG